MPTVSRLRRDNLPTAGLKKAGKGLLNDFQLIQARLEALASKMVM
jgi:hypothetical protein